MAAPDADPVFDASQLTVIELNQMNKGVFFPTALTASVTIRGALYPLTVVKTRLQLQTHRDVYSGMMDVARKILRNEGARGLYKGYFVSILHLGSAMIHVGTYEWVRHRLTAFGGKEQHTLRSFISGGLSSVCTQLWAVPTDVVSQYMQTFGASNRPTVASQQPHLRFFMDPLGLAQKYDARRLVNGRMALLRAVLLEIWRQDGLRGYYRGFFSSLVLYVPNSAIFWGAYHEYLNWLISRTHSYSPYYTPVQAAAAAGAGITSAVVLNPLDLWRARIQVQRESYASTAARLWREERFGVLSKGLPVRIFNHMVFSVLIVICYETVKKVSVKPEHAHLVRW